MKHKQTASTEINSSAAMSTHSSSSSTLSVSAPNTSNTSNSSIIPCVREVFGCKNKVNEYNDKECAICPDCRSKLEIMFNSSPFSPTLCPCCHDPSGGPPYAFCQECLGYLDQDGCMDSPFGSWNRDNITGDIICINLDFELL